MTTVRHGESGIDGPLNAAPCGFVSFTDDGTIHLVNDTLLKLLGYSRDELEGQSVEKLLAMGSRIFYQTHFFPLLTLRGEAEEIFLILKDKAGGDVGALTNAVRRERDGAPVTDCVFVRVRERRKYEEALLQAKQTAEQSRAEAEARNVELGRANALLESQAGALRMQRRQLREQAAELEKKQHDLQTINDRLRRRTAELERQRALADEANRAKSDFLTVMSHELRTPLNAIAGYVDLLDLEVHGPISDAQRGALERITRNQRHLLRLINEVLSLARIEGGHVAYDMADVALAEVVTEVIPMIEPQMTAKGLWLNVSVASDLVVFADREKLTQILLNLLTNAVKFSDAGGSVSVDGIERAHFPDRVFIRVSDRGIGIPPEMLEKVFQAFVQVDSSHTRRTDGTGLGLTISRDMARGMGGDLRARSVPGEGSAFTLVLHAGRSNRAAGPSVEGG